MPRTAVAIALSGGVDSAVAAALLLEAGHRVRAFFMELPLEEAQDKARQAAAMAEALAIPLERVNLRQAFHSHVIRSFIDSYHQGRTPNPCMLCNQRIKFGLLAQAMRQAGAEAIATGHYARIVDTTSGPALARGLDPRKDQSYFLARLRQEQLHRLLLPLGTWHKDRVCARAQSLGLPLPPGESQDVCFLPRGLAAFFDAQGLADTPGAIVDSVGTRLGTHRGICHYTVGQRRGLGLPDSSPWYVTALDAAGNQVVVGKKEALLQHSCTVEDLHWCADPPPLPWQGLIQLRSQHPGALGELSRMDAGFAHIRFHQPQRAITPGQFAVFYQDERVLGSAVIAATRPAEPAAPEGRGGR